MEWFIIVRNVTIWGKNIHKFKIKNIKDLLPYRMINDGLELIMIGPHENYYRDLKSYLKKDKKGLTDKSNWWHFATMTF